MFRSVKGLKPFFWRRTIKNTRRDIFSSSKIAAQKYAGFALTRFAVPVWSNYNKGGTVLSIKSDLASEIIDGISEENLPKKRFHRFGGVDITEIEIAPGKMEELFSRPAGKYITMEAESILDPTKDGDGEIAALAAELSSLLPKKGTVLAVGIGNEELTADSLGAKAIGMMTAGSFLGRRLCCLSTGVCGKTGFSPPEMINSVIAMTKPAALILIDALAAEDISHIGKTVQLTNGGICPGSGAGRERFELSEKTLGVPAVCVGLPTVAAFPAPAEKNPLLVAPCGIDVTVKRGARLIALAAELAVFPALGLDVIKELSY